MLLVLILWLLLMLVGISEGRRNSNRRHSGENQSFRNRGTQITETVDEYTVFKRKLTSPCGFHRLSKRSTDLLRNKSNKSSFVNESASRTINLVYKLVTIAHSAVEKQPKRKHNKITFQRRRRSNNLNNNEFSVTKLELSNLIGGMEFLNDAHISLVSRSRRYGPLNESEINFI